jgi:hypothetical protein
VNKVKALISTSPSSYAPHYFKEAPLTGSNHIISSGVMKSPNLPQPNMTRGWWCKDKTHEFIWKALSSDLERWHLILLKVYREIPQSFQKNVRITCSNYPLCGLFTRPEPLRTLSPIYRTGVPLPYKCCILYISSKNISTEYFKHAAHSPFFTSKCHLFYNATFFGSCVIHILHTWCAKI